jgi:hypothetical protein
VVAVSFSLNPSGRDSKYVRSSEYSLVCQCVGGTASVTIKISWIECVANRSLQYTHFNTNKTKLIVLIASASHYEIASLRWLDAVGLQIR